MGSSFRPEKLQLLKKLEKGPFLESRLENMENLVYSITEGWKSWKNIFVTKDLLVVGLLSQLL